ncbi:MAG: Rossmann-like fold-containing protein [Aureispira sp.]
MGAIHQDRVGVMTNVHGQQQTASTNYTAEEKAVADKINGIFATAKIDVDKRLSNLDTRVQQLFENGAATAQRQFEAYVERRLAAYKEQRYEGVSGKVSWLSDAFTGLPDEVNAFFVEGRDLYIRHMKQTIQYIARLVARELTAAKKRVQQGRQEVANYVESLPDNLRKVGKQAASEINKKFDKLNSAVDAKQEELIDSLATKYAENLKAVDDRIEQLKEENKGLVDVAFEQIKGTWETIQKVKAMLTGALQAAGSAIKAILLDPIGFLSNLIDGVGQGFTNFLGGIQQHMTTGFVTWLTGQMSSRGIEMPEDVFSLEGIFSIATQSLNLTWEALRERAVGQFGEGRVEKMEEGFEIFKVIKQDGMAGAWEHLKEQFSDLKETIMDSMIGMIIREVVEAGIISILALLTPAGAFVKAAMMIVDVAKFFINQGSQLVELVNAFTASITAIATGNVGQVAKGIEKALIVSIPLLIGFLAALVKIGDIAAKVQKIFKKLTGRIDKVIDNFIERAGKWFKDKKGRNKAKKGKKKAKKDKEKEGKDEVPVPKSILFSQSLLSLDDLSPELAQQLLNKSTSEIIYKGNNRKPKQVTNNILDSHKDAHYNDITRQLTLPHINSKRIKRASSVKELGRLISGETGVQNVILYKRDDYFELGVQINPYKTVGKFSSTDLEVEDNKKILLLGEANFSFAKSLANQIGGKGIIATSFESKDSILTKYKSAKSNIRESKEKEVQIFHQIDATKIDPKLGGKPYEFEFISFNFPYVAGDRAGATARNIKMLSAFLQSAFSALSNSGKIYISSKSYWLSRFHLEDIAEDIGLRWLNAKEFDSSNFPDYEHRKTDKDESADYTDKAVTLIFSK